MRIKSIIVGSVGAILATAAPSQEFRWAHELQQPGFTALDTNGNTYVAGAFRGTADFDPGEGVSELSSRGNVDGYVCKFDPAGLLLWAKQFQGDPSRGAWCDSVAVDGAGDVVVAGGFVGLCDVDPGPDVLEYYSPPVIGDDFDDSNIFIVKLNSGGELVWAGEIGGDYSDICSEIALDNDGNVYGVGYYDGAADFDPGPDVAELRASGWHNAFVFKLTSGGQYVWAKQFGADGDENGDRIAVDSVGNVITCGTFEGSVDFDPGEGTFELSSFPSTVFISKLDSSGNFVWAGSIARASPKDLVVGQDDSTYLSGGISFGYDTVDVDPGPGIVELNRDGGGGFVIRLTSSNDFQWVRQVPFSPVLGITDQGNLLSAGAYEGTLDLDPGEGTFEVTSAGGQDAFLARYDSEGRLHWARTVGGNDLDFVNGLAVSGSRLIATGRFSETVDFDPGPEQSLLTSSSDPSTFLFQWMPDPIERIPPVINNVPEDETLSTEPGLATAHAIWAEPRAIDNVEVISLTSTHASGDAFPVGETQITYTASDAAGNETTASFTVTVRDNEKPVINGLPENILSGTDPGQVVAVIDWTAPSATDNVGVVNFTASHIPGFSFPLGLTNITYFAEDAESNATVASFRITVEDREEPVISGVPATIEVGNAPGKAIAVVEWPAPDASDNVEIASFTNSHSSGSEFPLGETSVQLVATDTSGNQATSRFSVKVNDVEAPQITKLPGDIEVHTGSSSASVQWEPPVATDNSGEAALTASHSPGAEFPLGDSTVTYQAIDSTGNEVTASFTVSVLQFTGVESFDNWLSEHGYAADTQPHGDQNRDGFPNVFHYLFDLPLDSFVAHDERELVPETGSTGDPEIPIFEFKLPVKLPLGSTVHAEMSANAIDWKPLAAKSSGDTWTIETGTTLHSNPVPDTELDAITISPTVTPDDGTIVFLFRLHIELTK